jgi:hypothetical protein
MDIRGRSRIEIRCAEEDASRENRQSFKAHRGRNSAKSIQPRIVARLKSLSCKQPQARKPRPSAGLLILKGETARHVA